MCIIRSMHAAFCNYNEVDMVRIIRTMNVDNDEYEARPAITHNPKRVEYKHNTTTTIII